MSAVVTFSGPVYGNFILERGDAVVIGRSLNADLSIDDLRVSRRHCRIEHTEQGLTAKDLTSANGTFLNGKRIKRVLLRSGDLLQVGNAGLKVDVDYSGEDRPVEAYLCSVCSRDISLQTFADGDVIQLDDRFICPQCREKKETPEFSLLELDVIQRLYAEGFEVLEKLSVSGMVPIYKARKTSLGQLVALKALPLNSMVSQKKISRFVQEAKTQARLRHRHIVAIYDVRQSSDLIYIVMELIEGETLLQMIERAGSRLAVRDALRVAYQVALALAHAHGKGIVHRDLKPSNVMVTPEGDAKLIDFGLAKNLQDLGLGITSSGETLGTMGYMPPEQVGHARDVDTRADIYGLGASMYHCLAGRPPFIASTEAQLVELLGTATPPLENLVGVPLGVVSLIVKMMQRNPKDRFQSPQALIQAMEDVVTEMTGIKADSANMEFLLKIRDEESDMLQTWRQSQSGRHRTSAFLGSFRESELVEFLGMLEFNHKSGTLSIASGGARGTLWIHEGRIVRAESAGVRDMQAIQRILTMQQGDFEFTPGDVRKIQDCNYPISQVVLEAMRNMDELRSGNS
jgi:serine/threonine protein kinase